MSYLHSNNFNIIPHYRYCNKMFIVIGSFSIFGIYQRISALTLTATFNCVFILKFPLSIIPVYCKGFLFRILGSDGADESLHLCYKEIIDAPNAVWRFSFYRARLFFNIFLPILKGI